MPQARLPDVNTAYNKYRNEFAAAVKDKNWNLMHGSLNATNALLPIEYRVRISTREYLSLSKVDTTYECKDCTHETKKEEIQVFDLIPDRMETLLVSPESQKVWICPKCHVTNKLRLTAITKEELQNPVFLGVVPSPPIRGVMHVREFERDTEIWGRLMEGELEQKMAQFRADHWMRGGEEDDLGIDGGEEEDSK